MTTSTDYRKDLATLFRHVRPTTERGEPIVPAARPNESDQYMRIREGLKKAQEAVIEAGVAVVRAAPHHDDFDSIFDYQDAVTLHNEHVKALANVAASYEDMVAKWRKVNNR